MIYNIRQLEASEGIVKVQLSAHCGLFSATRATCSAICTKCSLVIENLGLPYKTKLHYSVRDLVILYARVKYESHEVLASAVYDVAPMYGNMITVTLLDLLAEWKCFVFPATRSQ